MTKLVCLRAGRMKDKNRWKCRLPVTSADFVVILLQVASQSFLFHRIHELEGLLLLVRGSPANNARSRCPYASSVKIAPGLIPKEGKGKRGRKRVSYFSIIHGGHGGTKTVLQHHEALSNTSTLLLPLHAYLEDGEMRCGTCMVCLVLMGRRACRC